MDSKQKATNVFWHEGEISREDRYKILPQIGATIWFTGLSGSGKSTIAVALEKALHNFDLQTGNIFNIKILCTKSLDLKLQFYPNQTRLTVKLKKVYIKVLN